MTIASPARAAAFNDWAKAQGWPSLCDPDLAFESEALTDLLAIWRKQAGTEAIPQRSRMSARALKHHLGHVAILERVADGPARYRVRLMGTRITQLVGEMQGKFLEEVVPAGVLPRWYCALNLTLAEGRPLRFVTRVDFGTLDFLQAEILLVPLLEESDTPSLVLGGASFKVNVAQDFGAAAVRSA
ncbi:MAG: PAS domain-containing protein [Rhizomicrobium sp.]|jgi:hypothetical protein